MGTQLHSVLGYLRQLPLGSASDGPPDGDLLARFVTRRDQDAFLELVRRHGPLVLGVCRRLLRDEHDAEDAFQATFLVLARKAGSLRGPGSLAGWLYAVACRTAQHGRAVLSRRRTRERHLTDVAADPAPETAGPDFRPVLDEELLRLPDRYRRPVVLCYLQGKTYDEAAGLLRWPKGTVATRLARARELLRGRLARRGLTLPAAALAVTGGAALAETVPAALAAAAVSGALADAAGAVAGSGVPFTLADGVLRALWVNRLRAVFAVVLVLALGAGAGALAFRAWASPPPDREAPAGVRGSEEGVRTDAHGDPLPEGATARLGTLRLPRGGAALAFAPDGKTLAVADWVIVRLWDPATGKELRRLEPAPTGGNILQLAFSPDGKTLVAAQQRGDPPGRWDVATGQRLPDFQGEGRDGELAFAPDGRLATSFIEGESPADVKVWDPATGKELLSLGDGRGRVGDLAFSPDGRALLGVRDKAVCLWDLATGEERWRWREESPRTPILGLLWDLAADSELLRGRTPGQSLQVAYSPDGRSVAVIVPLPAGGNDVMLRDARTGEMVHRLGPFRAAWGCAFSPDGKTLACHVDGVVRLFETATGREPRPRPPEFRALAYSPDGTLLASADDGDVRLWDRASGKELRRLVGHEGLVHAVAFSPDGRALASGGEDGTIRLWDARTGKELCRLGGHKGEVTWLAFSPDGRRLAEGRDQARTDRGAGQVRVWDVKGGTEVWAVAGPPERNFAGSWGTRGWSTPSALAFSADGASLTVADGTLVLHHDAATGRVLRRDDFRPEWDERGLMCLAFSGDGRTAALGRQDGTVEVWETLTGQEVARFEGHEGPVGCVAFSPDGRSVASGGMVDRTALVWDVAGSATRQAAVRSPEEWWEELGDADPNRGRAALWALAAEPAKSVPLLRERLRPAAPPDPRRLERLLADLDHDAFTTREAASRELRDLGLTAEPALRRALDGGPSPEVRRRAELLLERLPEAARRQRLRLLRAVEVLEHVATADAREVLKGLAAPQGSPDLAKAAAEARASLARLDGRVTPR